MKCDGIIVATAASVTTLFALAGAPAASAQQKEQGRVENAGLVMTEILNIRESIPDNLLEKLLVSSSFPRYSSLLSLVEEVTAGAS